MKKYSNFLQLFYDESIEKLTYKSTLDFVSKNKRIEEEIIKFYFIHHSLYNLISITFDTLFSGQNFPNIEADHDLRTSIKFAFKGDYKYSLASLRNVLELGFVAVYFDIDDNSAEKITDWLHSNEDTPYLQLMKSTLIKNKNFLKFQMDHDFFESLSATYKTLCNYTHTKGIKYSSHKWKFINENGNFYEEAFLAWFENYKKVITDVCILFLIKYPIGAVPLPLEKKFGIDIPAFSHMKSGDLQIIKETLDKDIYKYLLTLAYSDENTRIIIEKITSMKDLTAEEIENQLIAQDKSMATHFGGYTKWRKYKTDSIKRYRGKAKKDALTRLETIDRWATENMVQ